jgi:hypothetical protein
MAAVNEMGRLKHAILQKKVREITYKEYAAHHITPISQSQDTLFKGLDSNHECTQGSINK